MMVNFVNLTQSRIPRVSLRNCLSQVGLWATLREAVLIIVIEVGSATHLGSTISLGVHFGLCRWRGR